MICIGANAFLKHSTPHLGMATRLSTQAACLSLKSFRVLNSRFLVQISG
jgi:hypothetical protein